MIGISKEATDFLLEQIIDIPNYPKPGIIFRDITPCLVNAASFKLIIDSMAKAFEDKAIDYVAGIEARGFILGSAIAYKLNAGFVPLRKKGKLPRETISVDYGLEYGENILEIHKDDLPKGARILLVDDILATGGSAMAGVELLNQIGVELIASCFFAELKSLEGRERLANAGVDVKVALQFH